MIAQIDNEASAIHVGRRVRFFGGIANPDCDGVIVAVHGTPNPNTPTMIGGMFRVIRPTDCSVDVVLFDGRRLNTTAQCSINAPGIGIRLLDRVHGPGMIEACLQRAAKREADQAIANAKAADKYEQEVARLKAENPHLTPLEKYGRVSAVAKNVRAALKNAGIKPMSVRSESYSGGTSIRITLQPDAPTPEYAEAQRIADLFQYGEFNGMEDIYEYKRTPWTDVFGGAKYNSVERGYMNQ